MKVIIDKNIKEGKYILQLGDIVQSLHGDAFYVATYQYNNRVDSEQYILWSLDGDCGYNGFYDTLENLTDSLDEDVRIFKVSEYELRLVKKR